MSWLVFVIISIGLYFGARYLLPELFLGEQPKVIYKDTGNAKIFRNKKFRVEGKPDAILLTRVGYIAEEFKSRKRGFYESDIVQAKAAALAARSEDPISSISIRNQTEQKIILLPPSDQALFDDIAEYYNMAARAKQELLPARAHFVKCRHCAVKYACSEAKA